MVGEYVPLELEDKAGYNQAAKITEILAMLRTTYIANKIVSKKDSLNVCLECCRSVLDIISAKVNKEIVRKIDNYIVLIDKTLPEANEQYRNNVDGNFYYKNFAKRGEVKRMIEKLWRKLEQVQDEYGYGMISEDDSGL